MTFALISLLTLATIWIVHRSWTLLKQAIIDWKAWNRSLSAPIIDVEDEILTQVRAEWPLQESRWPSPVNPKSIQMKPVRCRAYARAAASRSRSLRYQSEAWILLGAALLGWRIPIFITQNLTPDAESINNPPADIFDIFRRLFPLIGVLLMVAIGLLIRRKSDDYETATRYYEQTAEAAKQNKVLDPITSRIRPHFWKDLFTGLLGHEPQRTAIRSVSQSTD